MGALQFFTAWANAPFTVSFGIATGVAALQASGATSLLVGDHDADGEGEGAEDAGEGADEGPSHDALGIGRIPSSLAWQTGAIAFAIAGWALNARWLPGGEPPPTTLLWTVPAGLVAALASLAGAARLLGPLLSPPEATSRSALIGREGVVISSRVTPEFGEVRIRDDLGHDLRLICALAPGAAEVGEGRAVVVVDVDDGKPLVTAA
jgi:hypothetical protein